MPGHGTMSRLRRKCWRSGAEKRCHRPLSNRCSWMLPLRRPCVLRGRVSFGAWQHLAHDGILSATSIVVNATHRGNICGGICGSVCDGRRNHVRSKGHYRLGVPCRQRLCCRVARIKPRLLTLGRGIGRQSLQRSVSVPDGAADSAATFKRGRPSNKAAPTSIGQSELIGRWR